MVPSPSAGKGLLVRSEAPGQPSPGARMRPAPPVNSNATGLAPVMRMGSEDQFHLALAGQTTAAGDAPPASVHGSDVRRQMSLSSAKCRTPTDVAPKDDAIREVHARG